MITTTTIQVPDPKITLSWPERKAVRQGGIDPRPLVDRDEYEASGVVSEIRRGDHGYLIVIDGDEIFYGASLAITTAEPFTYLLDGIEITGTITTLEVGMTVRGSVELSPRGNYTGWGRSGFVVIAE